MPENNNTSTFKIVSINVSVGVGVRKDAVQRAFLKVDQIGRAHV